MTVSLMKPQLPDFVRVPGDGDAYDVYSWDQVNAPLWWDDASYIRYQADDGPYGEFVTELALDGDAPLVRRWVDFEFDSGPALSRPIRRLVARFGHIVDAIKAAGATDREVIWTGCGGRW